MVVHVLDNYYLAITFLISLGWQLLGFAIAFGSRSTPSPTSGPRPTPSSSHLHALLRRPVLRPQCGRQHLCHHVGVRLGAFQLFRMIKMGGDTRFDEMRSKR